MFRLGVTSKDTTKTMNMCDRGSLMSPCHKSEIRVISNINYQSKPGGCANTNQGLGSFISSIMAETFPSSSSQSPFTNFHFSKPKLPFSSPLLQQLLHLPRVEFRALFPSKPLQNFVFDADNELVPDYEETKL